MAYFKLFELPCVGFFHRVRTICFKSFNLILEFFAEHLQINFWILNYLPLTGCGDGDVQCVFEREVREQTGFLQRCRSEDDDPQSEFDLAARTFTRQATIIFLELLISNSKYQYTKYQ